MQGRSCAQSSALAMSTGSSSSQPPLSPPSTWPSGPRRRAVGFGGSGDETDAGRGAVIQHCRLHPTMHARLSSPLPKPEPISPTSVVVHTIACRRGASVPRELSSGTAQTLKPMKSASAAWAPPPLAPLPDAALHLWLHDAHGEVSALAARLNVWPTAGIALPNASCPMSQCLWAAPFVLVPGSPKGRLRFFDPGR